MSLKYPPTTRQQLRAAIRGDNHTGICAVYTYSKSYMLRDGTIKETWCWEASWPDDNHQSVSESFTVKTYGEEVARQMAIRARREGLHTVKVFFGPPIELKSNPKKPLPKRRFQRLAGRIDIKVSKNTGRYVTIDSDSC